MKIQKCECQIEIEIALMVYTSITPFDCMLLELGGRRAGTTIWGTSSHHNAVISVIKQRGFNWYSVLFLIIILVGKA